MEEGLPRPSTDTLLDMAGEMLDGADPKDVAWLLHDLADWYHDSHPEDRHYAPSPVPDLAYDSPPTTEPPMKTCRGCGLPSARLPVHYENPECTRKAYEIKKEEWNR